MKALPEGRLAVEQRSRAVLAVWAACCIVDAAARRAHPDLSHFGLPLQYQDLRWLSLADGLSLDALQAVCTYLRARAPSEKKRPFCFSLRAGDKTAELAELVASRDRELLNVHWAKEERNAEERRRLYWDAVRRKQLEVARLRVQLKGQREAMEKAQKKYNDAAPGATGFYYDSDKGCNRPATQKQEKAYSRKQELSVVLRDAQSIVGETKAALSAAEAAPDPVVQPLPKAEADALPVLLFLRMDDRAPALRVLSRLCFAAQEMLIPGWRAVRRAEPTVRRADGLYDVNLDWAAHCTKYQHCSYLTLGPEATLPVGRQGEVRLVAPGVSAPPQPFGPKKADDCKDDKSCGVWHPVRARAIAVALQTVSLLERPFVVQQRRLSAT